MAITNDLLQQVCENPAEGAQAVCRSVLTRIELMNTGEWTEGEHTLLLEAAALLLQLEDDNLISHMVRSPDLEGSMASVCNELRKFIKDVQQDLVGSTSASKLESLKKGFSATISGGFGYEFTDGDLKRIQLLINQLREMVAANTELDSGHKQRMLKRLEKMQSELHKKMSDISRFYELMGDAGVALGKLGEGAKPIVEAIKELAGIAWKSQARAEQLQTDADNPLIGQDHGLKLPG